jgi:hypothetical protein
MHHVIGTNLTGQARKFNPVQFNPVRAPIARQRHRSAWMQREAQAGRDI